MTVFVDYASKCPLPELPMTVNALRAATAAIFCAIVIAGAPVAQAQSSAGAAVAPGGARDEAYFAPNEPAGSYKSGKVVHARRVTGTPPQIDGRLNDEIWNGADAATGFTQRDPDNGQAMTEDTRIQVAYDNRYLYIAVDCLDSGQVSSGLGRRDEEPPTDMVNIGIDPRHDHLTGYLFQTNPSSWQGDMSLFDDDQSDRDYNSNWEVRSQVTETGWSAEFRIPFSQMRFVALPTPGQVWGFDAKREIKRKGEQGFWVARPRGERGDTSRFGHLVFDEPLTPPGRLELLPYALSRSEVSPIVSSVGAVTSHVSNYGMAAGVDVRYGLGPSTTLAATINPDFGQVEQDPSVLNLSIYETFFPEKRPFFLEDSRTFVPPYGLFQLFHSRRIGRNPDRFSLETGDTDVERPGDTTILGAAKLTGKSSGWTYGVLSAETSREYAKVLPVDSNGVLGSRVDRLIEPFTSYNVVRVQRDLRGSSNIGAIATGVLREKSADAFTGGFDYNIRWNRARDHFNGHWVGTHAPIPGVGVKNGFGGVVNVGFSRKHGNFGVHADHFDTNFRVSDIGFFRTRTDRNRFDFNYEVGQPDPGKRLRQYWLGGFAGQSWNHDRLVFERNYETYFAYQFLNFWRGHFGTGGNMERQDDRDTRGGPPIVVPSDHYGFVHFESDSRKTWRWDFNLVFGGSRVGSRFRNWSSGISFQPSDRIQSSISASYNDGRDHAQWITNEDADGDGTTDYVYGTLKRDVIDVTMRATYAFNRDLTLQAYLQPFVAVGDYFDVRKLARPRSYDFSPVTLSSNPDFNAKSLNSNLVLRWEYVKGSTLFVVWNAGTFDDSRPGVFSPGRDLRGAFGAPANHVFMVKASYWINR
jgi:hypothetical protein